MVAKLSKISAVAMLLVGYVMANRLDENVDISNKYIIHAADLIPLFDYQTKKKFSYPLKTIGRYSVQVHTKEDTIVEVFYPDLFIKTYVFKDSVVGLYGAGLDFQTNMHGNKEEFARLIPAGSTEFQTLLGPERDGEFFKKADAKIGKVFNQCDEADSAFKDIRLIGWETGPVGYVYYIHSKEPGLVGEIIYRKEDSSTIHCSFKKSGNEKEYEQILKKGIRIKKAAKP